MNEEPIMSLSNTVKRKSATLVFMLLAASAIGASAEAQEACLIGTEAPDFGALAGDDPLHPASAAGDPAPHSALHGQGVYGVDAVYLNHLPIFMGNQAFHPHNFQVIVDVAFDSPDDATAYREDRLANPDTLYTAAPPVFDQMALVADDPSLQSLPQTQFFRGHFEQAGRQLIVAANLTVRNVIYDREFLLGGDKLPTQSYLLYGRGDDVFLTHLLSAPADFDQTLAVTLVATDVPTDTIRDMVNDFVAAGGFLELPDRGNEEVMRLRPGDTIICHFTTPTRAQPVMVELRVRSEPYCESGEVEALVTEAFNRPRPCGE
ncbi:MAG: hypothetical protein GY798_32825 [Hyphomicrobiales bacterium]|nr:hypothetical protein [Hyphomicrobiales bacterium]